jgi:hypothetical protein
LFYSFQNLIVHRVPLTLSCIRKHTLAFITKGCVQINKSQSCHLREWLFWNIPKNFICKLKKSLKFLMTLKRWILLLYMYFIILLKNKSLYNITMFNEFVEYSIFIRFNPNHTTCLHIRNIVMQKSKKIVTLYNFWHVNLKNQYLITFIVIFINVGAKGNKNIISNILTLLCTFWINEKSNTSLFKQAFKWNDQFTC